MDSHPFSAAYWRMAAGELKNVRKLTFAALLHGTLHGTVSHSLRPPVGRGQDHMGLSGQSRVRLGLRPGAGAGVWRGRGPSELFSSPAEAGIPSFPAIL